MRRVGKDFSKVETPLFEGMLATRTIAEEQVQADDAVTAAVQESVAEDIANEAIPSTPTLLILPSPPSHDIPSPYQKLEIIKLKAKRIEYSDDMEVVFNQGRMIDDLDKDEGIKFDANMRFLFKSREEMEEEDQEALKSINETPAQKAATRRKLNEEAQEVKDLKKHLETMFEKSDGQDAVWKSQRSVHGLALLKCWKLLTSCGVPIISLTTIQLILLVERRYPLSKFTLEQLVNVTRLQVEEESEMSFELLRFTRQQLQEYQQG
nr:hypothetical protein [Tanacetum cinerariifolium]